MWFELRQGASRDRDMQAAWTAQGEAAFRFEVLERLSEDVSEMLQRTELKKLGQAWRAKLA